MTDETQGYGQQDPSTASSQYNHDEFLIDQILSLISTAKLVRVQAVDTGAKTVDVLPLVKQLDGQGNATSHGTVNAIPYLYAQAGTNAVIMDPVVGDKGIMVCCDRDISAVLNAKDEATPGSFRKYDTADGIYLFGLPGINAAPTQWVKFTESGMELSDKNSNKLVSSSSGWEFTGPVKFNQTVDVVGAATIESTIDVKGAATFESRAVLQSNLELTGQLLGPGGGLYNGSIHIGGTLTADTQVSGGGIVLTTHVHAYISPGTGFTGPVINTNAPTP